MKKALVLNVGAGAVDVDGLIRALQGAIRTTNPDRVVMIASATTQPNANQIQRELRRVGNSTIHLLRDEFDYERVFLETTEVFRALEAEGFPRDQIDVDFTSGTKAMSAGLALAAVAFGCDQLRYIAVERHEGQPVSGTERYIARSPSRIRAHVDLQAARRLLEALQFEATRRLLTDISPGLLDEYGRRLHANLTTLAAAYDAWDKFDHASFKAQYRKPDADLRELGRFAVADEARGSIGRMAAASDTAKTSDWRKRISEDHLADLWNNAQRRMREGKLDDAVARLYRLTEMVAQFVLGSKYGIDTSNVELSALPAELSADDRAWLEAKAVRTDAQGTPTRKPVELGLREDFKLLTGLGHPIGPLVPPHPRQTRLSDLLNRRNGSILAHGTAPISGDDARALAAEVHKLAVQAVPDFEARCARLQFPWLGGEG